jgi:hypothetical protein
MLFELISLPHHQQCEAGSGAGSAPQAAQGQNKKLLAAAGAALVGSSLMARTLLSFVNAPSQPPLSQS